MAEKMADALLRTVGFLDGEGNEVDDAVIVGIVANALRRVSDHDAFTLTQIDPSIKDPVREALSAIATITSGSTAFAFSASTMVERAESMVMPAKRTEPT